MGDEMTDQTQPGWYHAQGDPPGTHRYWDGASWQGDPQPVGQPAAGMMAPPGMAAGRAVGGIGARFVALIIDSLVVAIPGAILIGLAGEDGGVLALLGFLAIVATWIWNFAVKQGGTGQTVGKGIMNLTLLGTDTQQPIGAGKAFGRTFLGNIINNFFFIDYIVALFDSNNQRIVDKIFNSVVYRTQ